MSLTRGDVVIDQTTGAETITPGWAATLYVKRRDATKIPDPNHPKGCVATSSASAGATTINVDTTAGYVVGDTLLNLTYVNPVPVGGQYVPAEVDLVVVSMTPTQITFTPALPSGASIPSGTKFGFEGTLPEWQAKVTKQVVKIRTQIAAMAKADADALIAEHPLDWSMYLASNSTPNALSTPVDSALVFPVKSGEKWIVDVVGQVSCTGVGGVKVGIGAPGGSTVIGEADGAGASDTTWTSALVTAPGTPVGAFAAVIGGNHLVRMSAVITAGADGNVSVQYASVVPTQVSNFVAGTRMTARRAVSV